MINKREVKHIAALARIGLTDGEVDKFAVDLSAILDWVEELKKADVSKAEPTAHITGLENRTRPDSAHDFGNKEHLRKLFPEEKNGYDKVKSVL